MREGGPGPRRWKKIGWAEPPAATLAMGIAWLGHDARSVEWSPGATVGLSSDGGAVGPSADAGVRDAVSVQAAGARVQVARSAAGGRGAGAV